MLAIGVWQNMSFAENNLDGTLSDGFTALGDPGRLGNYYYALNVSSDDGAFDAVPATDLGGGGPTPVPEPSSMLLFGAGLGVMARRWTSRRSWSSIEGAPLSHETVFAGNGFSALAVTTADSTSVPEPSSMTLPTTALVGVTALKRRLAHYVGRLGPKAVPGFQTSPSLSNVPFMERQPMFTTTRRALGRSGMRSHVWGTSLASPETVQAQIRPAYTKNVDVNGRTVPDGR